MGCPFINCVNLKMTYFGAKEGTSFLRPNHIHINIFKKFSYICWQNPFTEWQAHPSFCPEGMRRNKSSHGSNKCRRVDILPVRPADIGAASSGSESPSPVIVVEPAAYIFCVNGVVTHNGLELVLPSDLDMYDKVYIVRNRLIVVPRAVWMTDAQHEEDCDCVQCGVDKTPGAIHVIR